MIKENVTINIGDLVQATDEYHRNYREYHWSAYKDFYIAEVIQLNVTTFGDMLVRAIDDRTGHTMQFAAVTRYLTKL